MQVCTFLFCHTINIMCNSLDHDEIYTLEIGKYVIHNVDVNLVATIQFKRLTVVITLPLPINYPLTAIGTSPIVKKEGLFRAMISVISSDDQSWMEVVNLAQQRLNIQSTSAIALNSYYVIPRLHNIELTGDELVPLSGLGRKVLCLSMFYITNKFMLQPYTTIIVLEASGAKISSFEDVAKINYYLNLPRNDVLDIYRRKYPELYNSGYGMKTVGGIANLLVLLENNADLVNYYKYYLGLKQLSHSSLETLMGTTLDNMLNHCNEL